ncbi:MAG TPA: hypothetical protein VF265_00150, partial [Nevskiaceae bacterium]
MVDHVRVLSASFAAAAIGALVAMQANAAPVDTAADTANRALGLPSILIPWTTDRAGGPMTGPPGVIPQPTPAKPGLVLGASLGELYTDNLTLAGSAQPKQSSWITTFEPFVRGAAATPRFTGLFDYSATGYLYAGQPSDNQVAQDFRGQGSLVVVPDHLFIDGAATYGRELVNNALSSQSGTFFLDNNQSNVTTGSLSPYWTQEVGDLGRMTLRYTHGRVIYNDHGIPDESSALLDGVS